MLQNSGNFAKFIVAVIGAITASLSIYYSTARWEPVIVAALTAASVFLVPNQPKV